MLNGARPSLALSVADAGQIGAAQARGSSL